MAHNTNNTTTPPPSNHVPTAGVVIVDIQYCSPKPVDLTIAGRASGAGDYAVTDDKGNLVFKVNRVQRSERIMYDVGGNPILSMRRKLRSNHGGWNVFRGHSFDENDLIFSVRRSSIFRSKNTCLHVFMAAKKKEKDFDFKVERTFSDDSCSIYGGGDCSIILAQKRQKYPEAKRVLKRDTFTVTVHSDVDLAFVAALFIILREIDSNRSSILGLKKSSCFDFKNVKVTLIAL